MYVNVDGLNDAEVPINSGKKHLENAISYCFTGIPQDFKCAQDINIIGRQIINIESELERVRYSLASKRESYASAERKNVSLISNIADRTFMMTLNAMHNSEFDNANILPSDTNVFGISTETVHFIEQFVGLEYNGIEFGFVQEDEYLGLQNYLSNVYGLEDIDETTKLLSLMGNNSEILNYASAAEKIVTYYKDNPEEFSKKFGFDLYRKDDLGQQVLNSDLLYSDMYININDDLIIKNNQGKNIVNPELINIGKDMTVKLNNIKKLSTEELLEVYMKKKNIAY